MCEVRCACEVWCRYVQAGRAAPRIPVRGTRPCVYSCTYTRCSRALLRALLYRLRVLLAPPRTFKAAHSLDAVRARACTIERVQIQLLCHADTLGS